MTGRRTTDDEEGDATMTPATGPDARATDHVYVAGCMRSGTTLMGELLGAAPDAVTLGEMSGVLIDASRGGTCACGKAIVDCPVWSPALAATDAVLERAGDDRDSVVARFRTHYRYRRLHKLMFQAVNDDRHAPSDRAVHDEVLDVLVESAARAAKAHRTVDTSKTLPYLHFYVEQGLPVSVVHIVRDPRDVVASNQRTREFAKGADHFMPPGEPIYWTVGDWNVSNLLLFVYCLVRKVPYVRVRFEELQADPVGVLGTIGDALGIGVPVPNAQGGFVVDHNHAAVGNPRRGGGVKTITPATGRRGEGLTRAQLLAIRAFTLPGALLMRLLPTTLHPAPAGSARIERTDGPA